MGFVRSGRVMSSNLWQIGLMYGSNTMHLIRINRTRVFRASEKGLLENGY